MVVELKFDGSITDFEKAMCAMDDEFDFYDNLFYELDYGGAGSVHHTEFGDIEIKAKEVSEDDV